MILYCIQNPDGVFRLAYKEKTIDTDYKDKLHNYDECKVVRILDGSGVWNINGKNFPFVKNDIFVFSRLDFRKIQSTSQITVIEQVDFLPSTLGVYGNCTDFFFNRYNAFSNKIDNALTGDICDCFDKLRYYALNECVYKDELILNIVTRIALLTASCFPKSENKGVKGDGFTSAVMQYVSDNLKSDLSVTTVSAHFGFSAPHFSKMFKSGVGLSFTDYVSTRRINSVIVELNNSDDNILDIAFRYGFRSSSGFYKAFSRVTGVSPKNFKL